MSQILLSIAKSHKEKAMAAKAKGNLRMYRLYMKLRKATLERI